MTLDNAMIAVVALLAFVAAAVVAVGPMQPKVTHTYEISRH
jgi:hypothetical protein